MSLSHYQRVIKLLSDAALVITPTGGILLANQQALKIIKPVSDAHETLFAYTEESANAKLKDYLRRCARTNQSTIGLIQFAHGFYTSYGALLEPKTTQRDALILLRIQPQKKSNVHFRALLQQLNQLNQQMSRRLQMENQLRNITKRLEITLQSIGDGLIITNTDNHVSFLNPVAESLTGYKLTAASELCLPDVLKIEDANGHRLACPGQMAVEQKAIVSLQSDVYLMSNQGNRLAVSITAAPIELNNNINGVILVVHDITEKRRLEQLLVERADRLDTLNRRKNQFLTMLAHELRSPLTPIRNAAQLLKMQGALNPDQQQSRQVIDRQIIHFKRLVDDLLDVSRITSGKMRIVKKPLDLVALVDAVWRDYRPQFSELDITAHVQMTLSEVYVNGDDARLTQVLHNLLNNALKFTPQGGDITLFMTAVDDEVTLHVKDNGIGICESALTDLFEPFTQARQSLDRSDGGLGLGLSVVKGIVELHQGTVSASSGGEDQGTTIKITLPRCQSMNKPEQQPTKANTLVKHRILLVEDDPDAATTMTEILKLLGHEVHWENNGLDGVDTAKTIQPTLIICDIGLPGLDGFAVASALRKAQNTKAIPMVALTGYGEADFVQRAKQVGFDHHITKPASLDDIQAALAITR